MAITMRMVARIFVFVTEVTQGPLSSVHYTHIKHTPKSRCAICSGFEDTTKMSPRSRGTCPGDLAGDLKYPNAGFSRVTIPIEPGVRILNLFFYLFTICNQLNMNVSKIASELHKLTNGARYSRVK